MAARGEVNDISPDPAACCSKLSIVATTICKHKQDHLEPDTRTERKGKVSKTIYEHEHIPIEKQRRAEGCTGSELRNTY